jgi:hypothetical protein
MRGQVFNQSTKNGLNALLMKILMLPKRVDVGEQTLSINSSALMVNHDSCPVRLGGYWAQ